MAENSIAAARNEGDTLTRSPAFLRNVFLSAVIPGIISYLSSNLAILADGILVSQRVGVDGLAAVNLSQPVILLLSLAGGFLASGGEILSSQALGKNNPERAQRIYSAHLTLSAVLSAAFILLGLTLSGPIASLLCSGDAALTPLVREYSRIYLLAAPALIFTFPPFWYLPLDGKNTAVTVMMVIMGGGNILLDLLFLWVLDWGLTGAALASVLSAGLSAAFGMWGLHHAHHSFRFSLGLPRGKEWLELAVAGSPEASTNLFQTLRVLTVNSVMLYAGGSLMVAQYAVVCAMTAIADAVVLGVPQSGTAILGVYCGERDSASAGILLRQQLKISMLGCGVLTVFFGFGSGLIGMIYGVEGLAVPLWLLCASLFPSAVLNVAVGFYRVTNRTVLANAVIVIRVFGACALLLPLLRLLGWNLWLFEVLEMALAMGAWAVMTGIAQKRGRNLSRWMLLDQTLERSGRAISFSSAANPEAICASSERIGDFCSANDMVPKQSMRISLALEEMMVLITDENGGEMDAFDVRVFSLQGVIGIRIRYGGKDFNPLSPKWEDDDRFFGVQMIRNMVEQTVYQRTFGVNSLLILI